MCGARNPALAWLLVGTAAATAWAQEARFFDQLEVRRVVVPVRVLDARGQALRELGPSDFEVVVDGARVAPEAVDWIDAVPGSVASGLSTENPGSTRTAPVSDGRLVVLLFQVDFHRSRLPGVMRMSRRVDDVVAGLQPEDHVAVLVLGSHLELHLDFTRDRQRLAEAVRTMALVRAPAKPTAPAEPMLSDRLDPAALKAAVAPESALRLLAEALEGWPGSKTIVYLGWGMGRLSRSGVWLDADYGPARRALVRGHTTVFSLDLTEADFHSLEVGLQQVASDTGGFYARTHQFPDVAVERLAQAMAGHYLVTFESPTERRGDHRLRIRLRERSGQVLAPTSFNDAAPTSDPG